MQRLSLGILIAVCVFAALVSGTLVARSRSVRTEPAEPVASKADYRIKELHLEEDAGTVRWRLVAEQAEIFEGEERTGLRRPVVDIYQARRSWQILGEEGDVRQRSKDLEVRKNVVLLASDGLRIETSVLRWEASAKRLWTDAPVTITREGTLIRGSGLDVRMGQEQGEVRGRVRATFTKVSRMLQ